MEITAFSLYPASFLIDEKGFFCLEIRHENMLKDHWLADGRTLAEAMDCALSGITDAADRYAKARKLIPAALPPAPGDVMFCVPLDIAVKIMLRNAMTEQGIRISDLAAARGVRPQKIFNLLNFDKSSKLELLRPLFDEIGRPLHISC